MLDQRMRPERLSRCLIVMLALILSIGCITSAQAQRRKGGKQKKSPEIPKRVLLLFATDYHGDKAAVAGGVVSDVVKSRLATSDRYEPSSFRSSNASIRRAVIEHTLTEKDVSPPFDSNQKIQKLMQIAGYDLALSSSLEDFTYDAAKHCVTVAISLTMIDLTRPKSKITSLADFVTTPDNSVKAADDPAAEAAARNLVEKLMTQLLEKSAAPPSPQPTSKGKTGK